MARAASNIEVHLRRLATAKPRIAKLKRGELLSSMPMAEMLGVRWPALRDWCGDIEGFEASGAFQRGGNGVEWQFDPRKVHAFLTKHFELQLKREGRQSRQRTKSVGLTMPLDEAAPSLAETKDLVNLTLTVVSMQERQGVTTRVDRTCDVVSRCFEGWSRRVMGIKTELDPNGALTPALRKALEESLRRVCAIGREGVQEELRLLRANSGKERTG